MIAFSLFSFSILTLTYMDLLKKKSVTTSSPWWLKGHSHISKWRTTFSSFFSSLASLLKHFLTFISLPYLHWLKKKCGKSLPIVEECQETSKIKNNLFKHDYCWGLMCWDSCGARLDKEMFINTVSCLVDFYKKKFLKKITVRIWPMFLNFCKIKMVNHRICK